MTGSPMKLASVFLIFYGHPQLTGKRLVRAIQRMQFCAKNAKIDLNPTDLVKRNFVLKRREYQLVRVALFQVTQIT
jgi:hypothetical protein